MEIHGLLPGIPIPHCMRRATDQQCQFYFNLPICLVVVVCNLIKVSCMYMAASTNRREAFLTIGDSLSSFLNNPHATTQGRLFISLSDMTKRRRQWAINTPQLIFSITYFLCNGLLTSMLAIAEYNDYGAWRKPLRVSGPKG